jgi:tetratricopeptide (TPR) repeat protein
LILTTLLMLAQTGAYDPEIEAVLRRRKPAERAAPVAPKRPVDQSGGLSAVLPPEIAKRLDGCIVKANADADAGITQARKWVAEQGGAAAAQCLGYALGRADKWTEAADAFETGAHVAGLDPVSRARLLGQAGNAALVSDNAKRAIDVLDRALAEPLPATLATGEIHLDRARARVAMDDLPGARVDLDKAVQMAAADPLAWLLSATLARRMNDLPLARAHIAQARARAADDAGVALEEGVILALSGNQDDAAKAAFRRVGQLAPGSETARKADVYLTQLGEAPVKAAAPAAQSR